MSDTSEAIDLWKVLEENSKNLSTASQEKRKTKTDEQIKKDKKKVKRFLLFADFVSIIVWTYILTKLLLFDVDNWLISVVIPQMQWIIDFKFLIFFGLVAILGMFFWRWFTLLIIGYIILFPMLAIIWRIPRLFFKAKGWLGLMGFINMIGIFFKSFRYNLISKGIGIIAAAFILFSENSIFLIISAFTLIILLSIASVRTLKSTFHTNWFLEMHERFINKIIGSGIFNSFLTVNEEVKSGKITKLDSTQLANLTNNIQFSLITTRSLYFWAFQLQKYKEKYVNVIFNMFTFLWLLAGGAVVFWLINIAIYKIDPSQFISVSPISNLAMLVYSISGLFFSDGAGINASGTLSYLSRLLAGIFGSVFILNVFVNIFLTFRQAKDGKTLNKIVKELKVRAHELDDRFEKEFSVSPEEGIERLVSMRHGFHSFLAILTSLIPKDFMRIDEKK